MLLKWKSPDRSKSGCLEQLDPVSPALLCQIESPIGISEHDTTGYAGASVDGDPDADRKGVNHRFQWLEVQALVRVAQALSRTRRFLLIGAWKHHDELLTAVPRDQVDCPHFTAQHLRDQLQCFVARRMPKLVVYPLEVVEVDHHHSYVIDLSAAQQIVEVDSPGSDGCRAQ